MGSEYVFKFVKVENLVIKAQLEIDNVYQPAQQGILLKMMTLEDV